MRETPIIRMSATYRVGMMLLSGLGSVARQKSAIYPPASAAAYAWLLGKLYDLIFIFFAYSVFGRSRRTRNLMIAAIGRQATTIKPIFAHRSLLILSAIKLVLMTVSAQMLGSVIRPNILDMRCVAFGKRATSDVADVS